MVCQKDITEKRRRRHLDTTVTVAVGSTLGIQRRAPTRNDYSLSEFTAVVSVVTVAGYALWRHIKIKAVGYDTMN